MRRRNPAHYATAAFLVAPEFPVGCLDDRRFEQRYTDPQARYNAMIEELFDLYRN
jgi:hypothetical protein